MRSHPKNNENNDNDIDNYGTHFNNNHMKSYEIIHKPYKTI